MVKGRGNRRQNTSEEGADKLIMAGGIQWLDEYEILERKYELGNNGESVCEQKKIMEKCEGLGGGGRK